MVKKLMKKVFSNGDEIRYYETERVVKIRKCIYCYFNSRNVEFQIGL